jgi:hypothetical protein
MHLAIMLGSLLVAVCLSVLFYSTVSQAGTGEDIRFKYYKCITVPAGASLWSISEEYMDENHYDSVNEYMNEMMHINRLTEEDTLRTGQSLILPYYSAEYLP